MKNNMGNNKDFIEARNRALFLTIISFMFFCLLAAWENIVFLEIIRMVLIIVWYLTMPLLVIYSWIICILSYFELEIIKEKRNNLYEYIWIYISVGIIILLGIGVIYCALDLVKYIALNWKFMDALYHCIGIKICTALGWIVCFFCSIRMRKLISASGIMLKKVILLLVGTIIVVGLVCCYVIQEEYVSFETELVWVREMTEYYEEHGAGPDVVPFFQN